MTEKLEQRIRYLLETADSAAAPHELSTPSQAWSRLQFRLAYRPRKETYTSRAGTILVPIYILSFLMWSARPTLFIASLIAVLALAAAAAVFLCMQTSRKFHS